jgi:hypothetical protein
MDEWVQAYAACWDGVVYCFLEPCPRLMISTSTRCLYFSPSQLCLIGAVLVWGGGFFSSCPHGPVTRTAAAGTWPVGGHFPARSPVFVPSCSLRDAGVRTLDHLREGRLLSPLVPGLSVGSLLAAQRSSLLVLAPPPSGVCLRAVEVLGEVASA